jgi:hypothetical protein
MKSRSVKMALISAAVAVGLSGCGDSYDTKVSTLSTLLQWMQIGKSRDQWLEKKNFISGEWEKVALMFGYWDDNSACTEIVGALGESYPQWQYRCVPAN